MLGQCAVADLVICASEKQRDLWLGGMGLAGLIDVERYRARPDLPRLRRRGAVRAARPRRRGASEPVLKGVWPGIEPDDRVLLWAGGVWRWLDAITPIGAVERLRAGGRRVHLVFLGHGPARAGRAAAIPTSADAAIAYAAERGLEGECVHFNRGWVPYERARGIPARVGHRRVRPPRPPRGALLVSHARARPLLGRAAVGRLGAATRSATSSTGAAWGARSRPGTPRASRSPARSLLDDRGRLRGRRPPRPRAGAVAALERGGAPAGALLPELDARPAAQPGPLGAGPRDLRPVPGHPGRPARARRPRGGGAARAAARGAAAAPPDLELVAVLVRRRGALLAPERRVEERRHALARPCPARE